MKSRAAVISILFSTALLWAQTNPLSPDRDELAWTPVEVGETEIPAMSETDGSLYVRQTLVDLAESADVNINSISARRSKPGDNGMVEIRVYCGYDAEFGQLVDFLGAVTEHPYGIAVDVLNVSARRRAPNSDKPPRRSLIGNMVVSCLVFTGKGDPPREPTIDRRGRHGLASLVLENLAHELPEDAYLTNLQIKQGGTRLQIQGFTDDPFGLERFLLEASLYDDVENITMSGDRVVFGAQLRPRSL